jgi:methylmalonyl-CoA mutase N-terminal domain/subunit
MYRDKPWTETVYMGYGEAEGCNLRLKSTLREARNIGLYIAMDLPTQMGYNSDNSLAEGEVGRVGVAIDSLKDLEGLFNDIPIQDLRYVGTTAFAIGPLMISMFLALGEKRGIAPEKYRVKIANDSLREYITRGTYIFPPKPALRLTTDAIEYCARYLPHWQAIHVHGHSLREAGGNAVQEIAFSLAFALAYIDSTVKRGLTVDEVAPQFTFRLTSCMDFFEEVAKFRAVRSLWAKILRERYGTQNENTLTLGLEIGTSGSSLTAQQPLNNVVRVTIEALAAVLGGVQQVRTCAMDEALSIPSEDSLRLALRTQQIIAHESGVTRTVDPLGGSYYLEHLTGRLELEALEYLNKIDKMGGVLSALEQRFLQSEIERVSYRRQTELEKGERIVVGVNAFQSTEKIDIKLVKRDPEVERKQKESLNRLKAERDNRMVNTALIHLKQKASEDGNLILPILDAVRVYATVGEICDVLRSIYGEYEQGTRSFEG